MALDSFFQALLGAIVGGGVPAFVIRSLFQQLLSRNLERYKAQLQQENAAAVERLRADLRLESFREERLHERRLGLIADLYATLDDAIMEVRRLVYAESEEPDPEEFRPAMEVLNSLNRRTPFAEPVPVAPAAS